MPQFSRIMQQRKSNTVNFSPRKSPTLPICWAFIIRPFLFMLCSLFNQGFSQKTKNIIREQKRKLAEAAGVNQKILSLGVLMLCFIHFFYIFIFTGSTTGRYSEQYIFLHSSSLFYFVSLSAANFMFILFLIGIFLQWKPVNIPGKYNKNNNLSELPYRRHFCTKLLTFQAA